jgi:Concanavalin A-like lectin/glucanases superfamily
MKLFPLAGLLGIAGSAPGATLYVAKGGQDAWSGRLEEANARKTDGPVASFERACALVRALKVGGLKEPVTVLVRRGTYALEQTLVFTADDSGTKECPVTYRAYPGETVVLTGARPVRGWRKNKGSVYVADLAAQGLDDFRFRELFCGDERQVLARYPNRDSAHPVTGGLLYVEDSAPLDKCSFCYRPGSIPFEQWGDLPQAEVSLFPYHCWDHNILRIAQVDPVMNLVTLRNNVAGSIFVGNRYFVQNVLGALDAPGEWYSDWETGELYFIPPDGKAPADGDVTVPVLENLVELSGTTERPVEHVKLHGFRLQQTRMDGIALEGARNCEVTGNTVTQVGGVGINVGYLRNAIKGIGLPWRKAGAARNNVHSGDRSLVFSHPCQECRIAGNDVFSTGGEGVVLFGSRNVADNNHLYQTGTYDRVCAGLTICGDENLASHNAIHDVPRDGIFINGKLNVAEYNDIRNSMLYTADNAAIALRQHDVSQAVVNRGNVLRYNRLLDTIGYGSYPHCTHPGEGFASPFCSFGIYLDGSICGVTVYGNIIARTGGDSVFIQFGGGNTVENNIFVEGNEERVQFDSMVFFGTFMFSDPQGAYRDQEPPNRITHNVFCYGGPHTTLYRVGQWDNAAEWDRRQATFDDNLIWPAGQPVAVWMHKTMDCKTLAEWQAFGYDTRSVVADPLFVDAAKDDYRLKPASPAYGVGFRDINAEIERIGAYRGDERASWPLTNAVLQREQPVVFQFPKEPQALVDGFELTPPGSPAAKAHTYAEGAASAVVSTEAAKSGKRSLRFTDAPRQRNLWEPHVVWSPDYASGRIHCSLDLMNSKQEPADFYIEFRDWQGPLYVGPTFRVTRDGRLFANGLMGSGGLEIAQVPNGEWYNVTMDFALGEGAPKEYTLTLAVPGRKDVQATLPFGHADFRRVTWFGISSMNNDHAAFYVDNLVLGLADAEKVKGAAESVAIRGTGRPEPAPAGTMNNAEQLAGYWRFEETSAELEDSSGNGLNGSVGGAARAKGAFGRALYLDGSGATAQIPDSPLVQFGTGDFAVECWLYPVTLAMAAPNNRCRIIEKQGYPESYWNVDVWSDGRVQMEMADADRRSGTTISAGTLPEKAWTHLLICVDRKSRKVSYYLNGKLDCTRDLPPDFAGRLDVPGKALSTGTWQQFEGMIDELKVYRRTVSAEDVKAAFEQARVRYETGAYVVLTDD